MSTDPKPDPFAELRHLLAENARLRSRVEVLEHREKIHPADADGLAEERSEIARLLRLSAVGDTLPDRLRELVAQRDNLLSGVRRVTEALVTQRALKAKDTWDQDAAALIRDFHLVREKAERWIRELKQREDDLARIATYAGLGENATAAEIIAEWEKLAKARPVPGPHAATHSAAEPDPIPARWPISPFVAPSDVASADEKFRSEEPR